MKRQNNQLLGNLYRDTVIIQETSVCLMCVNMNDDYNMKDSRICCFFLKSVLCIPGVNVLLR
jgi:hypothetical protein